MSLPMLLFVAVLACGLAIRIWLLQRQIRAVRRHSEAVPPSFSNQVSVADHQRAAAFTVAHAKLSQIDALLAAAVLIWLTLGGGITLIDDFWLQYRWSPVWHGAAVVGSVMLVLAIVDLPLSIWRTFRVEARFGFNRTTPGVYVTDRLKGLLLGILLGGPLLVTVLWLMERSGDLWWLYAYCVWVAFVLLTTWAWPRFLAPIFNRYSPIEDAALRTRVENLLQRCGFSSDGIFVVDGSRRSTHGNAYFTGIGKHKRIVFFDTLLERLDIDEVEAVLAHELGHFRLRHVRQRLVISLLATFAGLALLGALARSPQFYATFGISMPSAHAALLLFMLVLPVFTFFLTPIGAWWSRRHEFEADAFANEHASARHLASALVKLYRDNASTLTPDAAYASFYYSHPPALVRIGRLLTLARGHG